MSTVKEFLFEEQVKLYSREYSLAVFLMLLPNKTNYYRCIIDEIKTLDLWINDNGHWVDLQSGPSELCDKIGETIERKVLHTPLQAAVVN